MPCVCSRSFATPLRRYMPPLFRYAYDMLLFICYFTHMLRYAIDIISLRHFRRHVLPPCLPRFLSLHFAADYLFISPPPLIRRHCYCHRFFAYAFASFLATCRCHMRCLLIFSFHFRHDYFLQMSRYARRRLMMPLICRLPPCVCYAAQRCQRCWFFLLRFVCCCFFRLLPCHYATLMSLDAACSVAIICYAKMPLRWRYIIADVYLRQRGRAFR